MTMIRRQNGALLSNTNPVLLQLDVLLLCLATTRYLLL